MQRAIMLDYETYYKGGEDAYSVKTMGNWRYTHDERFNPYLISAYDGTEGWVGHPRDFNWNAVDGALLLAHNAGFERAITNSLAEQGRVPQRFGWTGQRAVGQQWQCTANLTSFLCSSRSLADAIWVLEKRHISKAERNWMNGKTWEDAVAAGMDKKLSQYALADSIEGHGLWTKYGHLWPESERELSELTMRQCSRGVALNTELVDEYIKILQEVIFNLERDMPWTGRGAKPTSPKGIAEQCHICGIPVPCTKEEDEEGVMEWMKTYGEKFPWVHYAGHWRQLNRLLASLEKLKDRVRPDGTIDFSLLYFGAHTGRWSGGGSGFNMQNMRKEPLMIKNMRLVIPPDGLSAKLFKAWVAANTDFQLDIRKIFVPRRGKKFILCDLAQIEPRVLAWLVKNKQALDMMAAGMSPYEVHARLGMMRWTGGSLKDENPDMYALAKVQVLQLGYGCGWEKFQSIAATDYRVFLTEQQSVESVTSFREGNPLICDRDKGIWAHLDYNLRKSNNENLVLSLPSGRNLTYRDVRRGTRTTKDKKTGEVVTRFVYTGMVGPERKETYGGKLTENVVQAIARDVFCEHVVELERNHADVIFTCHDEAINEVDVNVKPADIEHVMSKCPEWIPGLPVASEAKDANHYMK